MPGKKHRPTDKTRKLVFDYTSVGIPQADISKILQIDLKTLRKHYREELDEALIKANAAVGGYLLKKASTGDTSAIIWWEKTRAKKSEQTNVAVSGQLDSVHKISDTDRQLIERYMALKESKEPEKIAYEGAIEDV